MARINNGLVTGLNVGAILVAISALGFSVWFHVKAESTCQRVLKTPVLVGAWCRVSFILWLYLAMLFLLIVGLITLTAFTVAVTNKGVGKAVSGRGVGDHRLGDYSKWLHKYVVNADNWEEIKSCLIDDANTEDYYKTNMTPLLWGCCKPPSYCGLEFHNATYSVADPDCKTWSNGQEQLCFDCYSCKKAVLDNIRREWRLLALINIGIIVFVIIVYSVGCRAAVHDQICISSHCRP